MFSEMIMRLEDEMRSIEKSVFDHPPDNYAKFMELVGRRNGIKRAIDEVKFALREEDLN